jgi:hypothetical protein
MTINLRRNHRNKYLEADREQEKNTAETVKQKFNAIAEPRNITGLL